MAKNCTQTGQKCAARTAVDTGTNFTTSQPAAAMEAKSFLTSDSTWQSLQDYYNKNGNNLVIKNLFAADPDRFNKYRLVDSNFLVVSLESGAIPLTFLVLQ